MPCSRGPTSALNGTTHFTFDTFSLYSYIAFQVEFQSLNYQRATDQNLQKENSLLCLEWITLWTKAFSSSQLEYINYIGFKDLREQISLRFVIIMYVHVNM